MIRVSEDFVLRPSTERNDYFTLEHLTCSGRYTKNFIGYNNLCNECGAFCPEDIIDRVRFICEGFRKDQKIS